MDSSEVAQDSGEPEITEREKLEKRLSDIEKKLESVQRKISSLGFENFRTKTFRLLVHQEADLIQKKIRIRKKLSLLKGSGASSVSGKSLQTTSS